MKIRKQPIGYDFEQPLLNKILRVHVALMYSREFVSRRSDSSRDYFDAKTRRLLPYNNWRVKLIKRYGT